MCIPSTNLRKIENFYEETEQIEKLNLQKQSIEKSKRMRGKHQQAVKENEKEQNAKNLLEKKITYSSSCRITFKLVVVAGILTLAIFTIYNKTN